MNDYEKLDLYEHNIIALNKVRNAFRTGQKNVSVIHATGTGKGRIAYANILDHKNEKIVFLVPTNAIAEHHKKSIETIFSREISTIFPNLEFKTYQSLINMTKEELTNLKCDLLIVDELHHLGAPIWGNRVETIDNTHPNLKKFGMTAYTIRDRGTSYERDMTNPDTNEIFSNSVVSEYDLYDALIDGILPKPIYKTVITEDNEDLIEIEKMIEKLKQKHDKSYREYEQILLDIKRVIHTNNDVLELIRKSIKPDGKYIYFCPLNSQEGKNDIDTIMNDIEKHLKYSMNEKDIIFYKSTSEDGKIGKLNRDCFYHDLDLEGNNVSNKLRIIFVKNQYNEGVHAPNVDGVFLGRHTKSDIVAFEQIGRALSVRGDTKKRVLEYSKYKLEELKQLAISRNIDIDEIDTKQIIIEKLISPIIIDLANNINFIQELETNLKDRIKQIQKQGNGTKRIIQINNPTFDIEVININLLNILKKIKEQLSRKTWDDWYELAKIYYEYHGNSEIPQRFKTENGYEYDEEGYNLGIWISTQRRNQTK